MEKEVFLNAEKRTEMTRGEINELRLRGELPAVLYGRGQETIPLIINEKEFRKTMHTELGENIVITLKVKGENKKTHSVIVKDWQIDSIKGNLLHIDFCQISLKKEIVVDVLVETVGEAPGVKEKGGVLEHILRELEVKCLPVRIPHSITVDISHLQIGENILVKDIVVPEGLKILNDLEQIVVNIVASTVLEEKTEEAIAGETAEPEVISKGKKEEEGDGGEKEGGKE
ncbi:50S ribosomal protein L25 [bacterium]|nr:50S ribosomal protein L25 [bacterium]